MEPETYAELLQEIRRCVGEAITHHGGEIVRIDGDGFLCIFGLSSLHEDAGRRAIEAALDINDSVSSSDLVLLAGNQKIAIHTGVHAGVVLLRSGDMTRGKYEILGEATNIAARLCDLAKGGEIIVSEGTLGGDRFMFATSSRELVAIDGHPMPIPIYRINRRGVYRTRFSARASVGLTPFAGRSSELEALSDWLGDPQSRLISLHGSAGLGKTRLLGEFLKTAEEAGWCTELGYCEAYLDGRPLQPFMQIAESLNSLPKMANQLDGAWILETLQNRDSTAPLLLAIDDWQWCDDASKKILAEILARPYRFELRIILAERDKSDLIDLPRGAQTLTLPPLSITACETVITSLLPKVDIGTIRHINMMASGSPLFIEEMCHLCRDGLSTKTKPAALGSWFDMAVQKRFDQLDDEAAAALRLAAVIGYNVSIELYQQITLSEFDEAVFLRLVAADFMSPDQFGQMVRFKHRLTRDAIYAGINRNERIRLHRSVQNALEDSILDGNETDLIGPLALHSSACGDRAKALAYAFKAADLSLSIGSLDRARSFSLVAFEQLDRHLTADGVDSINQTASLRRIIKSFGRAIVVDPDRANIAELERMKALAEQSRDLEAITLARYWLGAQEYGLGEPRRSLAQLLRVQELVKEKESPGFFAQLMANIGQSYGTAGYYGVALTYLEGAVVRKRHVIKPGQPSTGLAYCLASRGLINGDIGNFAQADLDHRDALEAMQGRDDPALASIFAQRCFSLISQGLYSEAQTAADFVREVSERANVKYLLAAAFVHFNYAKWCRTKDMDAFEAFQEAVLSLPASKQFQRIGLKYGWLAEAWAQKGEVELVQKYATLAFKRALKGDRMGEASAARALALVATGDRQGDAKYYLHLAKRAADKRGSNREAALNQFCEAQIDLIANRRDEAFSAASAAKNGFLLLSMHEHAARASAFLAENFSTTESVTPSR